MKGKVWKSGSAIFGVKNEMRKKKNFKKMMGFFTIINFLKALNHFKSFKLILNQIVFILFIKLITFSLNISFIKILKWYIFT